MTVYPPFIIASITSVQKLMIREQIKEIIVFSFPACEITFVCFTAFLVNDIYAFISWKRMGKKQLSYI